MKKAIGKREQIGVDLYHLQQELARLQGQLESSLENLNKSNHKRMESETMLKALSQETQQTHEKWNKSHKDRKQLIRNLLNRQSIVYS